MKQFTVCLGLLLFFLCMHSLASAQAGYVDFNPNISGTYVLPPASSEVAIHVTCYDDRVNGWYYHHLIIKKNGYDWWRKDDPYNYSDPDPSFGVGSWTLTGDEYEQFVFNGMISKYRTKTDTFTVVYPTPVAPTLASIGSTPGTYHPVLSWNDIGYYAVHQNTTNGYEIYRRDYEGINQLRVDWRKIASVSGTTTTWIDLSVGGAPMGWTE